MMRASLGLYNTRADVDAAADALTHISEHADAYRARYEPVPGGRGDGVHRRSFAFNPAAASNLERAADDWIETARN